MSGKGRGFPPRPESPALVEPPKPQRRGGGAGKSPPQAGTAPPAGGARAAPKGRAGPQARGGRGGPPLPSGAGPRKRAGRGEPGAGGGRPPGSPTRAQGEPHTEGQARPGPTEPQPAPKGTALGGDRGRPRPAGRGGGGEAAPERRASTGGRSPEPASEGRSERCAAGAGEARRGERPAGRYPLRGRQVRAHRESPRACEGAGAGRRAARAPKGARWGP